MNVASLTYISAGEIILNKKREKMVNFISGFVIGGAVVYFFMLMMQGQKGSGTIEEFDTKAEGEKAINIAKLKEFIATSSGKITNDQVEKMLGVSNATTQRYLEQLEKEGLIKQVGKEGQSVYYEKI